MRKRLVIRGLRRLVVAAMAVSLLASGVASAEPTLLAMSHAASPPANQWALTAVTQPRLPVVALTSTAAPVDSVGVDMAGNLGVTNTHETGFLYGLSENGTAPTENLLGPLKVSLTRSGGAVPRDASPAGGWACSGPAGLDAQFDFVKDQYERVVPLGSVFEVLVSDLWDDGGAIGPGLSPTCPSGSLSATGSWPGDPLPGTTGYNWTNYNHFLASLVGLLRANHMNVRFDIWNEPNGKAWGAAGGQAQYFAMWDDTVRYLRSHLANPVIVGPSYAGYTSSLMNTWLLTVKAAGTLPTYLNWHFSSDPVTDAENARSLMAADGVRQLPLEMNEYIFAYGETGPDASVGYQTWYISRLVQADFAYAEHAVWNQSGAGTLDNIVTTSGQPTAQWWGYERYARMSGISVPVISGAHTDGIASEDPQERGAQILLGNDTSVSGDVAVHINGLDTTRWLVPGNGQVRVTLQELPNTAFNVALTAPVTISVQDYVVHDGSICVNIPWTSPLDAWEIFLGNS